MRCHEDNNGTLHIVKECCQGSDEAKILEFLKVLKLPCEPIISLIETIVSNASTTCIVLPERQSIKEQLECFTNGGILQGMFLDLSRDLTIGLSFLHKNGIAHLESSPQTLCIRTSSAFDWRLSTSISLCWSRTKKKKSTIIVEVGTGWHRKLERKTDLGECTVP